jgi:two-component system, NtrC family, nitrogen regulation sensor histidine kinase GlnL
LGLKLASPDEILEALPDGVVVLDAEGAVVSMNAAAEDLFAIAGAAGRALHELGSGGSALSRLAESVREGEARGRVGLPGGAVEARVVALADGRRAITLRAPGKLADLMGDAVADAARMTALSAGLAHELRNPLAGLMGAADLLGREVGEGPLAEYADVIGREARRMERLVRQLLDVARPRPPERRPTNVHQVLDPALLMTEQRLPEGVSLVRRFDPSLPDLPIDADQLTQVFLNLLRNAAEAMAGLAGTITVDTGMALGMATGRGGGRRRTMARIAITDEGPGFAAEVLEQLYTPFLTTKAGGTGLGLALCRRLVDAHGGIIEVKSPLSSDGGTTVAVYLPTG